MFKLAVMPIDLPNAVPGYVITRFPPEPSWYLDIGHAKAALVNQHMAEQLQGQWLLRFDDTNPKNCKQQCVDSYMQDMPLLGLNPSHVTYASDYFEAMIDAATQLIEQGFLYADDTPVEEMRKQRLTKQASAAHDRPAADNVTSWKEMQTGSAVGQRFCLRFKLNPAAENGCMRDPVAYRPITEPHYRTGHQYHVYPTYDFAAPWCDAAEGVSHALRTLEFRDRDELYTTVQHELLSLYPHWKPSTIWEFPRIHMAYTPQQKAQQKALLAAGLVQGPNDPRLPTIRGLLRAGCHPEALRAFLLEQVTPARKETYHSWDKLWTLNRRLLDPTAPRHMAVTDKGKVLLKVLNGPEQPQAASVTLKQGHVASVLRYKEVWIDQADAKAMQVGDQVTLLAWGCVTITAAAAANGPAEVEQRELQQAGANPSQQQQQQGQQQTEALQQQRQQPGTVQQSTNNTLAAQQQQACKQQHLFAQTSSMAAVFDPSLSPKASKLKVQWVPNLPHLLVPMNLISFDHPVSRQRVSEDVDVVACFNHHSRQQELAWGDPSLLSFLKQQCSAGYSLAGIQNLGACTPDSQAAANQRILGDRQGIGIIGAVIQLQRKGLYRLDQVAWETETAAGITDSLDPAALHTSQRHMLSGAISNREAAASATTAGAAADADGANTGKQALLQPLEVQATGSEGDLGQGAAAAVVIEPLLVSSRQAVTKPAKAVAAAACKASLEQAPAAEADAFAGCSHSKSPKAIIMGACRPQQQISEAPDSSMGSTVSSGALWSGTVVDGLHTQLQQLQLFHIPDGHIKHPAAQA